MTWNYRICKRANIWVTGTGEQESTVVYGVHEVYYNAAGEIYAVTENPITVLTDTSPGSCETEDECLGALEKTLHWMLLALGKDVIDLDNIVYASSSSPGDIEDDE